MAEHSHTLTKPSYGNWLRFFCTPFVLVLLISFVLFVVRKRMNLMDWSQFFEYIQHHWLEWQILFFTLFFPSLLLQICAQSALEAQHETYKKFFLELLGNSFPLLKKIRIHILSWRIDLWICAALGILSALTLSNTLNYESLFLTRPPRTESLLDLKADYWLLLYGVLLLPGLWLVKLWDRAIEKTKQCIRSSKSNSRRIQVDNPIDEGNDDLFGWHDKIEAFCNEVPKAPDGTAFGIEAPWGTGKTSFINLCEQKWQKQYVVYRFELLKYAGNSNIIEQFVLGMLDVLEQHYYLPELRGAIQGYLIGLQGTLELSGGPLKITLNSQQSSIEDALQQISAQLERRLPEESRLIVVIDDLDRVAPDSVLDLLFALHKCFALPRLRYVLCYDQQQLSHKAELNRKHGNDRASQTLLEFLDKFVAARMYLHPTYQGLENYVTKQLLPRLKSNPCGPNEWYDFVKRILFDGALALINESNKPANGVENNPNNSNESTKIEKVHVYWTLLGNIRQLIWLSNQISLCWNLGINIDKHEFNARDLVYLLLLQQSFPDVFRRLRAMADSGEYVKLCLNEKPDNLNKFIEDEKKIYENNPWAESAIETLLRGLLDNKIQSTIVVDANSNKYRASDPKRLPAYLRFIMQENIPPLISSNAYLVWIKMQWKDNGKKLHDLLEDDVLKNHSTSSDDWQDKHEYALWEPLLSGLKSYKQEQREELLIEFLKALPRFNANHNGYSGRSQMIDLLGKSLRKLCKEERENNSEELIRIALCYPNYGMLIQNDAIKSLLGWRDAVIVYKILHEASGDNKSKLIMQKEFWDRFDSTHPKHVDSKQLQNLANALQGTRRNINSHEDLNPRKWLTYHWKWLYEITYYENNAELRQENQETVIKFLFGNCWGDIKPTEEQLFWWMDYVLYNEPSNATSSGNNDSLFFDLNSRLLNYAIRHVDSIDKLYQQHNKLDQLKPAINKLCGMPWNDFVKKYSDRQG